MAKRRRKFDVHLSEAEIRKMAKKVREEMAKDTPQRRAVERDIEHVAATERLTAADFAIRINTRP